MRVTAEVRSDAKIIQHFQSLPDDLRRNLRPEVVSLTRQLARLVREKLSGAVLHKRSGKLFDSIKSEMVETPSELYGRVYSSGVPYAAIHEYGGVTSPHQIVAKNAKSLAFMLGGQMRFFKMVNHPGSKIPERSYLRSSLDEMRDEIVARLSGVTIETATVH